MNFWRQQVIQPALDGDLNAAIEDQIAALGRDPSNSRACFALASLRYLQGDKNAAVTLFQQAIAIDPHYAAPHVSLGRIDAVEGRYEDAWRHAHEAARLGDRSLLEQMERYPNGRG
jgi:tetratricopeptide (TPR) repeat protein